MANLDRLREVVTVLVKFGFQDILARLDLPFDIFRLGKQEAAHEKDTWVRIRKVMEDLGPSFVKFGQLMSLRPDLLPPELLKELGKLQDRVQPESLEDIKKVATKSLGREMKQVFEWFEEEPLASASLSQVHRAALLEDGQVVAVKVQRPGIQAKVMSDLEILGFLTSGLHNFVEELKTYRLPDAFASLRRSLLRELDFSREARYMRIARSNLASDQGVVVPKVFAELSSENLLVMELIEGSRLADLPGDQPKKQRRLARTGLKAVIRQILQDGFFHADPHPGNILITSDDKVCFLDWGMIGRLGQRDRQSLLSLIDAVVSRDVERLVEVLADLSEGSRKLDKRKLALELSEVIDLYYAVELKSLNLGQLMAELLNLVREHGLALPPDYTVMVKALMTAEGTARLIYPDMDVIKEAEPLVKRLMLARFSPEEIWRGMRAVFRDLPVLGEVMPSRILNILNKLEKDELTIGFEHKNLYRFNLSLQQATNRLTMGIIIAAMLIASSLVISSGLGPYLFGFPALGVAGYVASGLLGLWLIINIIRSRKF
ncbi:ABC transporter [Dethiosulfatarculus sandiegensis]|uniref:ABC transporter n=1 Tax=Dethiosulfatarculus sandiegensis TaxID=1429043 RepID=A0A0D2HWD3_9BACT|nr:ABC transporter [Dethiosulfatarculus sandiegensis]